MTAPNVTKPAHPTDGRGTSEKSNPFRLEGLFADADQIFKPNKVAETTCADVIIAVDTNVLLLPYTIRKDGLSTLQQFYHDLRSANRLFVPARVAREFISNRDIKLAELLKMFGDVKSRINIGEKKLAPILDGVEGSDEMVAASQALIEAKRQYTAALERVEAIVQSWSGDDPVTSVYNEVFDKNNIVSPTETDSELLSEWHTRLSERIPPGYKDGSKDDTGIGDFLIWKSLLALGAAHKKDLIFVTGEEKADWFVRSNNRGAYPRPELIAEYRRHSGGKNIRLVELHEILREMSVPQSIVTEFESAEISAKNIIISSNQIIGVPQINFNLQAPVPLWARNIAEFRTRYGGQEIIFYNEAAEFKFNISEQGKDAIWAYPNHTDLMSVIPEIYSSHNIDDVPLNNAVTAFSVLKGQSIFAKNETGFTLIARLIKANAPKIEEPFEVTFLASIVPPGSTVFVP